MVQFAWQGVVFFACIAVCTPVGVLLATLSIPLLCIHKLLCSVRKVDHPSAFLRLHHKFTNLIGEMWYLLVAMLLECAFKIKLSYSFAAPSSDPVSLQFNLNNIITPPTRKGAVSIVIANHRTRIDWMLLWIVLARTRALFGLKIVIKRELRSAPLFGWILQHFRFLFLSRKWEEDQKLIRPVLRHYVDCDDRGLILLFPEGTDLSPSNVFKSQEYAAAHNLPQFRFVLNPRTTGFAAIRSILGEHNIENIFDLTLGFTVRDPSEGYVHAERTLINGRTPRCFHVHCRRFAFGPATRTTEGITPGLSDDEFRRWIDDRFKEKENLLEEFYRQNPVGFVAPREKLDDAPVRWYAVMVLWWITAVTAVVLFLSMLHWYGAICFIFVGCMLNVILTRFFGGVESLWLGPNQASFHAPKIADSAPG